MKLLAIGATGFIGRRVVDQLLAAGHEVAVLHRGNTPIPGVTEILSDRCAIRDLRPRFRDWSPDIAIDMILSSRDQAYATRDALTGIARRIVAISSSDVYRAMAILHRLDPGPAEPVPLAEDAALRTHGQTYSAEALAHARSVFPWLDAEYDKVQVERAIASDPNLPATILRLPMVYGPGDPLHRLHPVVKRVQDGRPAVLLEESFARWIPCRGYVDNVSQAIALAATSDAAAGRTYNVADAEPYTEAEWTVRIAPVRILPADCTPAHLRKPLNFEQHLLTDTRRIRAELGYAELVPVDEALRRTVEWERAHPPARINPAEFDYAAEDRALADIVVH
jgi:nucleoside-diphosphate-sugar epimerase